MDRFICHNKIAWENKASVIRVADTKEFYREFDFMEESIEKIQINLKYI